MNKQTNTLPILDPSSEFKDRLLQILDIAIQAPSAHNAQPWKLSVEEMIITIRVDELDRLCAGDLENRETFLSIGCLLENILVLLSYYGYKWTYKISNEEQQVKITVDNTVSIEGKESDLAQSILFRRSNRNKYLGKPVDVELLDHLQSFLTKDQSIKVFSNSEGRNYLAKLYREAFSQVMRDKAFREELSELMLPNSTSKLRGMPGYTIGMNNFMSIVIPFLLKRVNIGFPVMLKDSLLIKTSPSILILINKDSSKKGYIEMGRSLERIWLYLCSKGVSVAILQGIIEVPNVREKLKGFIGDTFDPQVFLRIGYSNAVVRPSPRKELKTILTDLSYE